jgi:hypothetical protein
MSKASMPTYRNIKVSAMNDIVAKGVLEIAKVFCKLRFDVI